jgi:hypothetical protein
MNFPRFIQFALLLSLCVLSCSCAGYRLGPTGGQVAGERSVEVKPVQNNTVEPRLSAPFTSELRRALQQDGTYRLETRGKGDVVVSVTITSLNREGISYQPSDVATVLDYRLTVTADVRAVERETGKVLLDRSVTGRTTLRIGDDLNSAERQAIPLLGMDLARNTTSLLVDGDW